MKNIALLLGLLGLSFSLSADIYLEPGKCAVTGEWLYLMPMVDSPYYYIDNTLNNPDVPSGTRQAQDFDFQSGFRIEAMFGPCLAPVNTRLSWIHFVHSQNENSFAPFLHPTQGASLSPDQLLNGTASTQFSFHLNTVEALAGLKIAETNAWTLVCEWGVQYSRLNVKNDLFYRDATLFSIFEMESRYWGVGPELGFASEFCLCGGLSAVARASGSILVGQSNGSYYSRRGPGLMADVQNENIWRFVPTVQMRAGLDYDFCICPKNASYCFDITVSAGYEFLSYMRSIDSTIFANPSFSNQSFDVYQNCNFQGPYAAVSLKF